MNIGDRLISIRRYNNLSQGEFAKIFEISQSSYARYENGESLLNSEKINLLCSKFKINANWLLTGEGEVSNDGSLEIYLDRFDREHSYRIQRKIEEQPGFDKKKPQKHLGSVKSKSEIPDFISAPIKGYSASAGTGISNFEDTIDMSMVQISTRLLGMGFDEANGGYFIRAKGNSMTPKIDSGDLLFVKDISTAPNYLEGLYIVNYDCEIYVKEIQLTENELVMRSVNKEYKDIIIPNVNETDIHLQIIAKVIAIVKQV
ncbi:MAG: XRE family transcriptional regulator [Brevinema sp.]